MKAITLFTILLVVSSCKMHENHDDHVVKDESSVSQIDDLMIGTVHVGKKDCPLFIETKEEDMIVTMYPVNLDEKLQIDGIKIKFSYHPSKARQPENCVVDKVVALENVSQINN